MMHVVVDLRVQCLFFFSKKLLTYFFMEYHQNCLKRSFNFIDSSPTSSKFLSSRSNVNKFKASWQFEVFKFKDTDLYSSRASSNRGRTHLQRSIPVNRSKSVVTSEYSPKEQGHVTQKAGKRINREPSRNNRNKF